MIINNKKLAKDLSTNKMEWLVGFIKELVVVDKLAIHEAIKNTKQNYCINFEWNNIDFIYMLFIWWSDMLNNRFYYLFIIYI